MRRGLPEMMAVARLRGASEVLGSASRKLNFHFSEVAMSGAFVLITAAKDEEQYIGFAIQSVLRQTAKPLAWFIVDDGSADQTAEIVAGYAADHAFIKLVRNAARRNEASAPSTEPSARLTSWPGSSRSNTCASRTRTSHRRAATISKRC